MSSAESLLLEAEKKEKSAGGFFHSLFGSSTSKLDEAAELYAQAGNKFKIEKNWFKAGEAYEKNAALQLKCGNKHDCAQSYMEAANAYKKCDVNKAIEFLQKAVDILTEMGRFTMAARHCQTIGELYETELCDLSKAMAYQEKAADLYIGEESQSAANKCLLKVAQFAAENSDYAKAIHIYENVASHSLNNTLLRYGVKDYFFRALICQLCTDSVNAANALQRYVEMLPSFNDTREYNLIKSLIEAVDEKNVETYTEAIKTYDNIARLDPWCTNLLLRVKKEILEDPDLR